MQVTSFLWMADSLESIWPPCEYREAVEPPCADGRRRRRWHGGRSATALSPVQDGLRSFASTESIRWANHSCKREKEMK